MRATWLLAITALSAVSYAENDAWVKVKELKSGVELRVTRDGVKQPITANLDRVTDDTLYIATKKEQLSIPKSEIQKLDARPQQTGGRVTKESTTKTNQVGNPAPSEQRPGGRAEGPSSSVSTSYSLGSKPDFETIYRRGLGAPRQQ